MVAGLRPGTPDNLPIVGRGAVDGLVLATGHFRNGIMLAPITADAVAATLAGTPVPTSMAPADPNRSSLVTHRVTKDNGLAGRHRWERRDEDRAERGAGGARRLGDAGRGGARRRGAGVAARGRDRARRRGRAALGVGDDAAARGRRGRGPRRDPGRRRNLDARRPRVVVPSDRRHRWLPLARADGGGARRRGHRDRHRRPAPHRPDPAGLGPRRDRQARPLRPPQHGRLLHRPRRGPHREARPRGLRDRLDQARGDRRRPHALPRRGRARRRPPSSSSATASPSSRTPTTTRSSPAASRASAAPR